MMTDNDVDAGELCREERNSIDRQSTLKNPVLGRLRTALMHIPTRNPRKWGAQKTLLRFFAD
jgi:hypothetical protein